MVLLRHLSLCHKEPAQGMQNTSIFCALEPKGGFHALNVLLGVASMHGKNLLGSPKIDPFCAFFMAQESWRSNTMKIFQHFEASDQ